MNARDWQTLKDNYLDNTYYPTDFTWRDQTVRNVGIRSRGTGSRSGVKPGLRVDFDRYTSSQKFLGLKSFVLRNNTQDATNMHERVSMLLFKRLGAPAPREAHTPHVRQRRLRGALHHRRIDRQGVPGADLQRGFADISTSTTTRSTVSRTISKTRAPTRRSTCRCRSSPRRTRPIRGRSSSRSGFRPSIPASDAAFKSVVGEYLDLSQFIRHVAVEVFVGDYDGFIGNYGTNNFYLYRFDNQKRFNFILWDKSEAFQAGPTSSIFHNITDVGDAQKNRLLTRVLSFNDLYNQFLDVLVQCARSASEPSATDARGWMEREVEREYNQIHAARARGHGETVLERRLRAGRRCVHGLCEAPQRSGDGGSERSQTLKN